MTHFSTCPRCSGSGQILVADRAARAPVTQKPLAQVIEELPAVFPAKRKKTRKAPAKPYTSNFKAVVAVTVTRRTGEVIANPALAMLRRVLKKQRFMYGETEQIIDGKPCIEIRGLE